MTPKKPKTPKLETPDTKAEAFAAAVDADHERPSGDPGQPIKGNMGKITIMEPPNKHIKVVVEFNGEHVAEVNTMKRYLIGVGYDADGSIPEFYAKGGVIKSAADDDKPWSIVLNFPDTKDNLAELHNMCHENMRTIYLYGTDVALPGAGSGNDDYNQCEDDQLELNEDAEGGGEDGQ